MHTFQGDQDVTHPPLAVWHKLRDPAFLVQCIPEAAPAGQPEKDRIAFSVQPNLGFVRGRLDVVLQLMEAQEPTSLRWHMSSKGIGTSSEIDIALSVAAHDNGSRVHWQADITQLGGLLRMVPAGLIRGAAQKVIEDIWTSVAENLK